MQQLNHEEISQCPTNRSVADNSRSIVCSPLRWRKNLMLWPFQNRKPRSLHFWPQFLPKLGLKYLCGPLQNRAPDSYWAVSSKLTEQHWRLIKEGLLNENFDQSLLAEGRVLAIEYESKASYANKHFENGGAGYVSHIGAIYDDWPGSPVPVLCLGDYLLHGELPKLQFVGHASEPNGFDDNVFKAFSSAIQSEAQRFVMLAFLSPKAQLVCSGELRLPAGDIKDFANQVADLNGRLRIADVGGVLSSFTQAGWKKDLRLLRQGEKAGRRGCNYYLAKEYLRYLRKLAENACLRLPPEWSIER